MQVKFIIKILPRKISLVIALSLLLNNGLTAQQGLVKIAGAMRNVMWKGELQGVIALDTISESKNLYGLGPLENLTGEILILDGEIFQSRVTGPSQMTVEKTEKARAPFFVHTNLESWKNLPLPKGRYTPKEFEKFIDEAYRDLDSPFIFKLEGKWEMMNVHIVNLPAGKTVRSPEDAHTGQTNFTANQIRGTVIGFFSRKHQSVFTHHDTYMHLHFISADRKMMGHVDDMIFQAENIQLFTGNTP